MYVQVTEPELVVRITLCQAVRAIGIVYELAPPSLEDLTHLALSGLVDSSNEVWSEG